MASLYDDDLWELVPGNPGPPPEHIARFVRELPRVARALDLGCGDGRLTSELPARELTGADVSRVALGRANSRRLAATWVELDPDAPLPFADGAFELVLCAETLEHVRDVQGLLSEVRRVLLPGGRLAVTTPVHGRVTGLGILARSFEHVFDPLGPHLRFFTPRSLRHVVDAIGFDVEVLRRERGTVMLTATR
jgi:SAM-dependent methyltransferase